MNSVIFVSVISFVLTVLLMPIFIQTYNKAKISGQQMHEDVKQHQAKAGTPTMGGIVFLLVGSLVALLSLIWSGNWTASAGMILLILVLYGTVGFLDDFLKVFRRINEGLNPRQKLILQLLGGFLFFLFADNNTGTLNIFGYLLPLGFLYLFFVLFWLVGFSNAVNLTDGIDGLSSISVVISLVAYGVIAFMQRQWDILLVIASMIGALLGFFLYNRKPAKVFMGDVGSLALGGMLATISMALHQEWTLLLIGLVYVIETTSVMLQVAYFKYTRKKYGEGRRIFRMTPFHHHLELGGLTGRGSAWSEWKVDFFLWGIGFVMSLITLALLYL
ncbi:MULTISPECIES: phospho-N-acetylmuramoyl-pentapeptide-transferase [unclassified Streptococcus]|uniref:phospho-N-acetylmuramoyl-pentapeptide- transferase n=1 Tax=unclassified Streptococcus TaxID=2608887 RepID=UPI001072BB4E|nr:MULTISPECIES: phospho-N-acetylmuramoyl-pentapeptide-transferase [unclassified Streptococcus]MBF0805540.1 phospho-N-acetylmuramoyl-pentapeptide-transferase [Streptococcus sp. 19428wA2_WM07]TFU28993.1 phospho-N-acetylmuramoyl-pentapeptide-transferase [Streptococcus sp. WM07]